jgi:hypothetical protein
MSYKDMKTSDLIRNLVSCGVTGNIPDPKLLEEVDRRLPIPERGFGAPVKTGIRTVTAEFQVYADSDSEAQLILGDFLSLGFHRVMPPHMRFDYWKVVKSE